MAEETAKEKWRANYVPAPGYYALNMACAHINQALRGFGCYLVGSSLERRDFRDVDIRYIMEDEEYDRIFPKGGEGDWTNALWSLMCVAISGWLREVTGLPVDFQIQRQTQANEKHKGKRSAIGIFIDYPGERPTDVRNEPTPEAPVLNPTGDGRP